MYLFYIMYKVIEMHGIWNLASYCEPSVVNIVIALDKTLSVIKVASYNAWYTNMDSLITIHSYSRLLTFIQIDS